jgi:GT2 family glycosyltransferase
MKISVVIPCKNEVQYIEECIRAIFNSELKSNVELNVFVVDGMSTDGTRDKINELNQDFPKLELLDNEKELTPFAFNIGTKEQDFDYLQIVGARHILSDNYIQTCINYLEDNKEIWCAGGRLINSYTNETSRVIAEAMSTQFGMGIGNFRTLNKTCFTDTVTSPMYPKNVFDEIGYFDERLIRNQDDDFNYRVKKSGGKILFINEIYLKYYVRTSLSNLKRQFFQYGYWKVFVNRKHNSITTLRQLVPALFVLFLIVTPFSLIIPKYFFFIFLPVLAVYLILVIFFGLRLSGKMRNIHISLIVYPLMHVSYGVGYIKGVFDFLLMNKTPSESQKRLSR